MSEILEWLVTADDPRQQVKVKHPMGDIIAIVFFAELANANEWMEIYLFAVANKEHLRKYLALPYGIPSHDTIRRAFAMVSPECLQEFRRRWNEIMSGEVGDKIRKILALDGKTQRGNGNGERKANHIVSAVDDDGFCLGEELVDEKSNEITAIPDLLKSVNVKGHVVTTDAMGCQKDIARLIRELGAHYMLGLKGNQGSLREDDGLYFDDPALLAGCAYHKAVDKARGAVEIREYWQTDDVAWLWQRKEWKGLSSLVMTRNTIVKGDKTTTETRYFISSLPLGVEEAARAIRGHWMVESFHWHLDVTFREDANRTLDKAAAYNLNIVRKMAINTLRLVDVGVARISMKGKRYMLCANFGRYLDILMAL
jgi:predicted transposase YbfD/YdcC